MYRKICADGKGNENGNSMGINMGRIWEEYGNDMGIVWEKYGNGMGTSKT